MDVHSMDEQQARQRLLEGGYFVALGVPPGVEFGIDLKSYKTGPQFKGVKMIPAGLHFAHFGTGEGEKQGIFFRSSPGSVAATQWDASAEDLVDAQTCLPDGALRALRESVLRLEMDANLGPHDFEQEAAWLNLTDCVTDSVLERCGVPVGAKVLAGSSAAEPGEPGGEPVLPAASIEQDGSAKGGERGKTGGAVTAAGVSGMEIVPHFPHVGRVARYSGVSGRAEANAASGAAPEDVTKRNMDGSESLRRLIASDFGGSWVELLGELQLSFVIFVSLSSLGGFRHWQALSAQLCRCGDALKTDPALFTAFIRMLHAHLKLVPEDFFDVELSKDNFLVPCLSALLQNVLPDRSLARSLQDAGRSLLQFLQQRFGLFAPGRDIFDDDGRGNSGGRTSASPSASALPSLPAPPPRSGGWDAGGIGDGGGEAGMSGMEGLSLMHLELSEEDQPAVVPFEEVVRALGTEALGLSNTASTSRQQLQRPAGLLHPGNSVRQNSAPPPITPSHSDDVANKAASAAGVETHAEGGRGGHPEPGGNDVGAAVLSTPSAEHTQRWRDIDRLLDSTSAAVEGVPPTSMGTSPSAGPVAEVDKSDPPRGRQGDGISAGATPPTPFTGVAGALQRDSSDDSSSGSASQATTRRGAAAPVAMSAAAAAAAKRYPLLFAATRSNEDVMMAAARLIASVEEEADNGGGGRGAAAAAAAVVQEAVTFLEDEVEASEDGAAAVWQSSSSS